MLDLCNRGQQFTESRAVYSFQLLEVTRLIYVRDSQQSQHPFPDQECNISASKFLHTNVLLYPLFIMKSYLKGIITRGGRSLGKDLFPSPLGHKSLLSGMLLPRRWFLPTPTAGDSSD